ncbi:MAG: class I SAM-dependent RNA methyltransferase [Rhodospirillales bacterium]|nr:class I SAM-dependent RNA methyltransferase [Rhodospirillales bacterium]MCW8862427.1 class I SAM-dependent RNA methyltransferase [Rhodospirillales bacterium]MCW8953120.1 class I SAM-dependent RNA methyltransferase [Rhodospirillales bacterium]MCW9001585.1 class I SAM-dependent RNA methyltransferase [Rhodospirillales bacterium]
MGRGPRRHAPRKRAAARSANEGRIVEATVAALGGRGDGIARTEGLLLYVPFSVPGDVLKLRVGPRRGDGFEAEVIETLSPGGGRAEAFCSVFGRCGGCAVQHFSGDLYTEWKLGILGDALARHGLDVAVPPLLQFPRAVRRRAAFQVVRNGARLRFGFNERSSHEVADIDSCPLLLDGLNELLAPVRAALSDVLPDRSRGDVVINLVNGAADVVLAFPRELDRKVLERLAALSAETDIARLSWHSDPESLPDPVIIRRPVQAIFGGIPVDLPPGAFLQPSAEGEVALVDAVMAGVGDATAIADLYAGCGSLTLPLAGAARVTAVEGAAVMAEALDKASGNPTLGGRVKVIHRDLVRRPLMVKELKVFDAVVFDPPRAGAREQAEALAESSVSRVVAVSCNPATFARDARILVDGGFTFKTVTAVDQFPATAHLEAVGVFVR